MRNNNIELSVNQRQSAPALSFARQELSQKIDFGAFFMHILCAHLNCSAPNNLAPRACAANSIEANYALRQMKSCSCFLMDSLSMRHSVVIADWQMNWHVGGVDRWMVVWLVVYRLFVFFFLDFYSYFGYHTSTFGEFRNVHLKNCLIFTALYFWKNKLHWNI